MGYIGIIGGHIGIMEKKMETTIIVRFRVLLRLASPTVRQIMSS